MSGRRRQAKKKAGAKKGANVFSLFDQTQIQEFKEAFGHMDQNRDGFVDKEDLKDMFASVGQTHDDRYLEGMVKEAPGPINFTMFLTLMGEKLSGTDSEEVVRNAFACFDLEGAGFLTMEKLTELLTKGAEAFSDGEIKDMKNSAPDCFQDDKFDYNKYVHIMKHGAGDE